MALPSTVPSYPLNTPMEWVNNNHTMQRFRNLLFTLSSLMRSSVGTKANLRICTHFLLIAKWSPILLFSTPAPCVRIQSFLKIFLRFLSQVSLKICLANLKTRVGCLGSQFNHPFTTTSDIIKETINKTLFSNHNIYFLLP